MRSRYLSFLTVISVLVGFLPCASAQVNNAGEKPYLGWSSFSQQTIQGRERQLLLGRVPPRNRVLAGKSD